MDPEPPIQVMIVDDHALIRSAIRQALEGPDVVIVGEAGSAEEALELAPQLRPDVLLIDIDLPGLSGIEAVRELAPRLPETRIVMLTASTDHRDLLEAVRHGATGYLTKDLGGDALLRAIQAACGAATLPCRAAMPRPWWSTSRAPRARVHPRPTRSTRCSARASRTCCDCWRRA